jgi:hypothetical protein
MTQSWLAKMADLLEEHGIHSVYLTDPNWGPIEVAPPKGLEDSDSVIVRRQWWTKNHAGPPWVIESRSIHFTSSSGYEMTVEHQASRSATDAEKTDGLVEEEEWK